MADSDCYDEPVGRLFIVKDDDTDGSAFPVFDGEIMIGRYGCRRFPRSLTSEHDTVSSMHRATDCEIRIRKPMVSKRHALLSVEGDQVSPACTGAVPRRQVTQAAPLTRAQVYIHNFSKHNRTAVNKRLVTTSRRLKHQDKIYIHDRVFRFEYGEAKSATATSAPNACQPQGAFSP